DVEGRIQNAPTGSKCTVPARPSDPADFPAQVDLNHDLITLAFQCDATRVISFMLGYALGGRSYPFIGVTSNGHSVTHHSGDPAKIAMEKKIDLWRVQKLVALVQKLKGIQDADGKSLLSNTLILYTSEIGDGDAHNQENKPILLIGQLGG